MSSIPFTSKSSAPMKCHYRDYAIWAVLVPSGHDFSWRVEGFLSSEISGGQKIPLILQGGGYTDEESACQAFLAAAKRCIDNRYALSHPSKSPFQ